MQACADGTRWTYLEDAVSLVEFGLSGDSEAPPEFRTVARRAAGERCAELDVHASGPHVWPVSPGRASRNRHPPPRGG